MLRSARAIRNFLSRSGRSGTSRDIDPIKPIYPSQISPRYLSSNPVSHRRAQSPLPAFAPRQDDLPLPPSAFPISGLSTHSGDADLRAYFDQPHSFSTSYISSTSSGLFLFPPLNSPASLPRLTDRTLIHGQAIVRRIRDAPLDPTGKELRLVVKNLDRLSDLLCGVIDMCESVRNVHPEKAWVEACDIAYERLCSFMNELNTDQGLYKVSQILQSSS